MTASRRVLGSYSPSGKVRPIVLAKNEIQSLIGDANALAGLGVPIFDVTSSDDVISYLETRQDVQLVVADVGLAGCFDGVALAQFMHDRWPNVNIVLLGYPTRSFPNVSILPLPYSSSSLARHVRFRMK
jgi:hypothetical protein